MFGQWEPVTASVPLRNFYRGKKPSTRPATGRGYGFITFENEERRNQAIEGMNGKTIGERTVNVKVAYENHQSQAAQDGDGENQAPSPAANEASAATATTTEGATNAAAATA